MIRLIFRLVVTVCLLPLFAEVRGQTPAVSEPAQVRQVEKAAAAAFAQKGKKGRSRGAGTLLDPRVRTEHGWGTTRKQGEARALAAQLSASLGRLDDAMVCTTNASDSCRLSGAQEVLAIGPVLFSGDVARVTVFGWQQARDGVSRFRVEYELQCVQSAWQVTKSVMVTDYQ